jgi:hypothetical protein
MHLCPKCGRSIDSTRFSGSADFCSRCGTSLRPQADAAWTDVARVSNLAEAGFLTDELIGLGIEAQIHQQQEFSALTHGWTPVYFIRVASDIAPEAAAQIRQHLADDADRDTDHTAYQFTAHESLDPVVWRPMALVILAGVSSFVLGQRFSDPNDVKGERRELRNSLSTALDSIDRPFVTEPERGRSAHRLSFDRRRQSWLLDTDRDGDGLFDSRQAFQASGAAW